jgi:hypothetical protein
MPYVSFMAHGIKLWAEYSNRFDDPELIAISLDKDSTNIEPLIGSDVTELAYSAIDLDLIEIEAYKRECQQEARFEQQSRHWV